MVASLSSEHRDNDHFKFANTPQPVVEEIQPLQLSSFLAAKVPKTTGIGTIEVPAADIFLPVFSGLKNEELLIGAGTIFPEREPSKII